jgi:hypothetical protein
VRYRRLLAELGHPRSAPGAVAEERVPHGPKDDYRFDSSKAERALGRSATPYRVGIAATL